MGRGVWSVCMSVHHVCLVHIEVRRGSWSSWNWNLDSYKTPCRCWARNPSLLKGLLVLCRPGWSQTHKDLLASVSQVLEFKVCTTAAQLLALLLKYERHNL